MPKVRSEYDSSADFSRYKSFAVVPFATVGVKDPAAGLRLSEPAQAAVRSSLTAKGLSEAPMEKSDFAVHVRGELLPEVQVTDWGYVRYPIYGTRRAGWVYYNGYHDQNVYTTENQRLTVEIFDNTSKKETWVGWIERSQRGKVDAAVIQNGIQRILEGFPPFAKMP